MTEMSKCEGEARANNRKAKLIFFYEWDIEFKWKTKKDKVSMNLLQISVCNWSGPDRSHGPKIRTGPKFGTGPRTGPSELPKVQSFSVY